MIKAAVIGHPVSHSLSPLIHQYWFRAHNIEGSYEVIDIESHALPERIEILKKTGYSGFNVTVPHKQSIMAHCDTLEDSARIIGAVNTVVISDGKIEGRNTDAFGFISNLKQALPGFDFKKAPALVLGAGGASRAAIHALLQEGAPEIILANRTRENAEKLCHYFPKVKVVDWSNRAVACSDAGLLVNTTTLGMRGQDALDMNLESLPDDAVVYDIVYKPLLTALLQAAQARNLSIVTGIGMLLHQARPAFASWTGVMPAVTKKLEHLVTEQAR